MFRNQKIKTLFVYLSAKYRKTLMIRDDVFLSMVRKEK